MTEAQVISHEEAEQIALAYIDKAFNNPEKPERRLRHSIPANPREDTDLRLMAYIKQQRTREATPASAGHAVVFWDGLGWYWTADSARRHGPFASADGLDDAITDAKRAGYKIHEVNRTRGLMPAFSPPSVLPLADGSSEAQVLEPGHEDAGPERRA